VVQHSLPPHARLAVGSIIRSIDTLVFSSQRLSRIVIRQRSILNQLHIQRFIMLSGRNDTTRFVFALSISVLTSVLVGIATTPQTASFTCNGVSASIVGTPGDDVIVGTNGDDVISGRGGNDTIVGEGGSDVICGNEGADTLHGGDGNDTLLGGVGDDVFDGGDGDDSIFGGPGNDTLVGGSGDDRLDGGAGTDRLRGGDGHDAFSTRFTVLNSNFHRDDRLLQGGPTPEVLWTGEPLVAPRGITQRHDALYVTDPARPRAGQDPRIVRFPLVGDTVGIPTIFFQRRDYLLSAKWSIPVERTDLGLDGFVIADQGEELPDGTFTGRGAKVFFLPVLPNGNAGEPQTFWEGPPFVCPTGIVVVGDFIYVTDPCAGPTRTRQGQPFPGSAFFIMQLAPGPPTLAWVGAPFASMIGVCAGGGTLGPSGLITLTVHDTDSGRIDPTETGGRPGFAPPAEAELWVFDIQNTSTAELSRPHRIELTERGTVALRFDDIPEDGAIEVITDGAKLENGGTLQRFVAARIAQDGTLRFELNSPTRDKRVRFGVTVVDGDALANAGDRVDVENIAGEARSVVLPKDNTQSTQFVNNKHGGRIKDFAAVAGRAEAEQDFFRISLDSERGHSAIWVFPETGGATPVALAQGFPLVRPLGAQIKADQTAAWIADQSGSLLFLRLPDIATLRALFP
jgi:Ca2+-binding RTX toxin-like protein